MIEPAWLSAAVLADNPEIHGVAASPNGFGLIGVGNQPREGSATDKLRRSRAGIFRATASGVQSVFDGPGWIEAIDGSSGTWFAVSATLKASGSGSDYSLLRSRDDGNTWETCGPLPARSIKHVLSYDEETAWVLGARTLAAVEVTGFRYREIVAPGERNPWRETLRLHERSVVIAGEGVLLLTRDGSAFDKQIVPGAARDVAGGRVLIAKDDQCLIVPLGGDGAPITIPRPSRYPLRLVAEGDLLRVLSRGADPAHGTEIMIHRSEDGGRTWSHAPHVLTAKCDIAGQTFGLGMDVAGGVHVAGT